MGATRRMQHYGDLGWRPLMLVALAGAIVILAGIVLTVVQLWVSIRTRDRRRDETGDPWGGRTLEWSTASPPPSWNFATLPNVDGEDAYWAMKRRARTEGGVQQRPEAIMMPRNSPIGVVIAFFAVMTGFALIWAIWWLAMVGLAGIAGASLVHAWRISTEVEIPAETILAFADARQGRGASI
jgi:cytochrome o ubiquinol oxidase subunit I